MRIGFWMLSGLAVALMLASSAAAEEGTPSRVFSGENLYHQHCGACHGVSADGNGPIASILDPKPPDLTRIAARRDGVFPDVEISRIIDGRDPRVAHGDREMPVWGRRFREGQENSASGDAAVRGTIQLLVAFLKSVQVEEPGN